MNTKPHYETRATWALMILAIICAILLIACGGDYSSDGGMDSDREKLQYAEEKIDLSGLDENGDGLVSYEITLHDDRIAQCVIVYSEWDPKSVDCDYEGALIP